MWDCLQEAACGHCLKVASALLAVILVYLAVKRQRARAREEFLRARWNSFGEDVVVLHTARRCRNGLGPSPFPIKLETYMRAAGIKYAVDYESPRSAKGKVPWISAGGEDVADSQLAIEFLAKKFGKDMEADLTEQERAISRTFRILIEDHFFWCLVLERYVWTKGVEVSKVFPPFFPSWYPEWLVLYMYRSVIGKNIVLKQTKGHGIGRHSREEVTKMGRDDLKALSAQLGDKPFLLGDKPCLADFALFGIVSIMVILPKDSVSPFKKLIDGEFNNLVKHHSRLVDKYWPDYEKLAFGNPYAEDQEKVFFVK